ncbi:MAG TPA: twin-arginine translocase TatA/TatE family subunit [Stellaceae bacterium]|jgi:sec-independent protein translocase protein TatA|nr:twin-arginine translocase TatA/TatE family subunit [Stellaceae bacterium]
MGSLSLFHWVIILAVVLLLFGSGRITNVMGDFAKGIKAFKKGLNDEDEAKLANNAKTADNSGFQGQPAGQAAGQPVVTEPHKD